MSLQNKSSNDLFVAGKLKLPFMKFAPIWVWRHKDNGLICLSSELLPTFSDALRIVKQTLFSHRSFQTSQLYDEIRKVPRLRSIYRFSRSTHTFLSSSFG